MSFFFFIHLFFFLLLPVLLMWFCILFCPFNVLWARSLLPMSSCPCPPVSVRATEAWTRRCLYFSLLISPSFWPLSLKTGGPETSAAVENHRPASSQSNRRAVCVGRLQGPRETSEFSQSAPLHEGVADGCDLRLLQIHWMNPKNGSCGEGQYLSHLKRHLMFFFVFLMTVSVLSVFLASCHSITCGLTIIVLFSKGWGEQKNCKNGNKTQYKDRTQDE